MKQFSTIKTIFSLVVTILGIHDLAGQTIFWTETFSNACPSNCLASSYTGWSVQNNIGGTSGASPNIWYVSCVEEGVTPPGCGSSCINDPSLHIGNPASTGGDMGASYTETAAANATYSLAVSPTINATGYSSITLNFDFIAYGSATCSEDRAQLWLSTDNGATWPASYQYCLNTVCCAGGCNGYNQGQWTLYTLALPTAFNNNPNIRIGFHWSNNGNGAGTDPSVAIDDIKLSIAAAVPLELTDFSGRKTGNNIGLSWNTQSEINVSHFEVERSTDAKLFAGIGRIPAKGNKIPGKQTYTYQDAPPAAQHLYYRLKVVDVDGAVSFSNIINPIGIAGTNNPVLSVLSAANNVLDYQVMVQTETTVNLRLFDIQGRNVLSKTGIKLNKGDNRLSVPIAKLPAGLYLASIEIPDNPNVKLAAKFVVSR